MKKGQEKVHQVGEVQTKSRPSSTSTDSIGINTFMSLSPNPSTSRAPYTPIFNTSQGRKSENRQIDKTDTPKKRNRRRERKGKPKPTVSELNAPSSSLTPHSSPSLSKLKPLHTLNHLGSSNKVEPKKNQTSRRGKSTEIVNETTKLENLVELKFFCEVHPVQKPQTGRVFRKRSKRHKYINLKSFLGLSKTCIFKTEINQLVAVLENLSLGPTSNIKNRKFFGNVDRNVNVPSESASNQSTVLETGVKELPANKTALERIINEAAQWAAGVSDIAEQSQHKSEQGTPKKVRRPKKDRHRNDRLKNKEAKESQEVFPPCFTEENAKLGFESGELIRGFVRVNPKNAGDSYVSNENSTLADYHVTSVADRNRALDGDEVLLKVKADSVKEGRKTAYVVHILNKVHPRTTVGNLKPDPANPGCAVFLPRDKRMPIMGIPQVSWPIGFKDNPKAFANILFTAQLLDWPQPNRALGIITATLGLAGDLKVETQSILKEFCLDVTPFSPDMVQYLPKSKEIPAKELEYREDIRKECVFTIDPLTARDLDDAVSVKELPNGHYEIGVHISDASFYLTEGTPLDQMVGTKGTTIYLVDSVYHMLPVELCLHCSLLPGEDKLAFSVFWEMDEKGEVYNTRFARTVLNSCAQLAYEHAQQMIEDPNKEFNKNELPQIMNGFTAKDLSKTVNVLKKVALNLREARVRNGALRIDQIKLLFSLNPRDGEPLDYIVYENKESHRLIEEFMLLANISVAKQIEQSFPDIAFLRCHEEPKYAMLAEAQRVLETCGIHVDISSSGGIHSSLRKYITDDYQGLCRGIVLNHIFAKPMTRARYFCSSVMDTQDQYVHYALSVPIYTHFTSPIRRYADIMVHRLLAASLGYAEKPNWTLEHVISIAANCNKQKYNAKRAGEASSDLYLAHYVDHHKPYVQDCVVVDVKERSFDAILLKTGSTVRVYENKCQGNPSWTVEAIPSSTVLSPTSSSKLTTNNKSDKPDKPVLRLIVNYRPTPKYPQPHRTLVEMFTVVKVQLQRVPNSYKLEALLLRPIPTATFQRSDSSRSGGNP